MQKLALLLSIIILAAGISLAQSSGFTYQGKLAASGAPANGDYQFSRRSEMSTDANTNADTVTRWNEDSFCHGW